MKLNINKRSLTLALVATLGLTACHKDLDRLPANVTTDQQVYTNPTSLKQALAKVYAAYGLGGGVAGVDDGFGDFLRSFFSLQELPTDEAVVAWSDKGLPDLHNLEWSSSNVFSRALYFRALYQIKLASDFIAKSEGSSLAEARAYRADARFLRAFQYWVLLDLYGNPPFVTEATGIGKVSPQQISRKDLFAYVERELLEVADLLPVAGSNEYGRASQAAAWALLARLYLNAEVYTGQARYADAAKYAEQVIASGKFALHANYEHLFLNDNDQNNPEVILSINYDGIKSETFGGATFLAQASTNADAAKFLGKDWGVGGWGGYRATADLLDLFGTGDKRALMGAETPQISDITKFAEGVWVYKYRNVSSTGQRGQKEQSADFDFPLFRLAEQYLIYAEAAARGAASEPKALGYLNELRVRAYGNASGNFTSLKLEDIIDERARELYWEGFRRTDLIRFGRFTSDAYRWAWKGGVASGRGVADHFALYPLPADDVQANLNLKQNTGY